MSRPGDYRLAVAVDAATRRRHGCAGPTGRHDRDHQAAPAWCPGTASSAPTPPGDPRRRSATPTDERRRGGGFRQVDAPRGLGQRPELRLVHGLVRRPLAGHVRARRSRRPSAARPGPPGGRSERRQGRGRPGQRRGRRRPGPGLRCADLRDPPERASPRPRSRARRCPRDRAVGRRDPGDRGALPPSAGAPAPRPRLACRASVPGRATQRAGAGHGDHRLAARVRRRRDRDAAHRAHGGR